MVNAAVHKLNDVPAIACRTALFDGSRTWVMGVLNVTPDSFSDGGSFIDVELAVARARILIETGSDILDVGGESTRPGAEPVDAETEWARVAPVLESLRSFRDRTAPISIDTYKAEVAARALAAGAEIVNDVSGGSLDPRIRDVCAEADATMIVSHLRGTPRTMQENIDFSDVFEEVTSELEVAIALARRAGVRQVIGDPGIGFGKTVAQNLELLARSGELSARLGVPVLVGPSRKGFLGALTGLPPGQREAATLGAVVASAMAGARFVRVHDPVSARQALAVADAIHHVYAAAPISLDQRPHGARS